MALPVAAKKALEDNSSFGLVLVKAVDILTKGQCFAWEFDTIFVHLESEYNITLSVPAADRLMACLAAKANPRFLWDMPVFQSMVQTLNHHEAITTSVVQCSVGECAWAVTEIKELGKLYNLDYSEEMYNDDPSIYIAGCAAADGFVCMPPELEFCEDEFNRMFPISKRADRGAVKHILELAKKMDKGEIDEDSISDVMVRKLQEVEAYVDTMSKTLANQLSPLNKSS